MPLFVTVTPGTTVSSTTTVDASVLNLLGTPAIDIRGTVDGGSLSLSANQVATANIQAAAVQYDKIQNVAANSILGNNTGSAATVTELSAANVRTLLSLVPDATTVQSSGSTLKVVDGGIGTTQLAGYGVTPAKQDGRSNGTSTVNTNNGSSGSPISLAAATATTFWLEPTGDLYANVVFATADEGKTVLVAVKQANNYGAFFTAHVNGTLTTIEWQGSATNRGSAPNLTSVAGAYDLFVFINIGTKVMARAIQTFRYSNA